MRDQTETFEKLAKFHNAIYTFKAKLDAIEKVNDDQGKYLLTEANAITLPYGDAYGEYTYLFDACGVRFIEIYKDFWDRIDKKGDYSE